MRIVEDYMEQFIIENGTKNQIEQGIQNVESKGSPDVVKLKEKLAVYNRTIDWAVEQEYGTKLLNIKRLQGNLTKATRRLMMIVEELQAYDDRLAAKNTWKGIHAFDSN
jgi:hypothetical protein